jgi:hypothetical protein
MNTTRALHELPERRAVLHVALRPPKGRAILVDGHDVVLETGERPAITRPP